MILGFKLTVCCRLVAIWWMSNMQSFGFIIAFHDLATLENWLTYQCPSCWPVVITMKKKLAGTWGKNIYRIMAGQNQWQQVCNWSNHEKTGRNCEGADFSWLSSKISRSLLQFPSDNESSIYWRGSQASWMKAKVTYVRVRRLVRGPNNTNNWVGNLLHFSSRQLQSNNNEWCAWHICT